MGKIAFLRGSAFFFSPETNSFIPLIVKGKSRPEAIPFSFFESKNLEKIQENIFWDKTSRSIYILLSNQDSINSLLFLESRLLREQPSPQEFHYINLVATLTSNALSIAENYDRLVQTKLDLEKQNQLLSTLFEISRDFSSLISKEQILSHLKYRIMGQLLVNRFAVFVKNENTFEEVINRFEHKIPFDLLNELFEIQDAIKCKDISFKTTGLGNFCRMNNIQIVSPMLAQGEIRGVLLLGKRLDNQDYSLDNLQFAKAFGNAVILALENSRLIQEEIKKKQIENEIHLALEIQQNLLPREIPEINGVDIYGITKPAKIVGGDYFDIVKLNENSVLVAIADVSGKGMPAAILMANVQAALKVLSASELKLDDLVNKLNNLVFNNTTPDKFITFFIGELNLKQKKFSYINAGHNPPIHFAKRDNKTNFLSKGGLILGLFKGPINYEIGITEIAEDDVIVLYTDGITEATNKEKQEFGEDRLLRKIQKNLHLNSEQICNAILKEVLNFAGDEEPHDDLTIVSIKIESKD
jgi:sigma-B regulation protein RsbU (phosphoserine phosphatase)